MNCFLIIFILIISVLSVTPQLENVSDCDSVEIIPIEDIRQPQAPLPVDPQNEQRLLRAHQCLFVTGVSSMILLGLGVAVMIILVAIKLMVK
jgi:hypothetical protein